MGAFKKEPTTTNNIEKKTSPSTEDKNLSNDATEPLSSEEIIRQHFKKKADKVAAEESARKKLEDEQNTHF